MLVLTRRRGEAVQLFIGDELVAEITVVKVGDDLDERTPIRLGIQAPQHVKILRSELSRDDNN